MKASALSRIFLIALFLWPISSSTATGQTYNKRLALALVGTIGFTATETTTRGKLIGCGFEFTIIAKDHPYKLGGLVLLAGSISSFYAKGKGINYALKLKGKDMSIVTNAKGEFKDLEATDFEIVYAYAKTRQFNSAGKDIQPFRCEGGGFCSVYTEGFTEIFLGLLDNDMTFGYNRRKDGVDVIVKMDINQVKGVRKQLVSGAKCFRALTERFKKQD